MYCDVTATGSEEENEMEMAIQESLDYYRQEIKQRLVFLFIMCLKSYRTGL